MDPTIGIICGVDKHQEHLLAFFYLNLRLHCDYPITFFDFGLSAFGKSFCQKRGQLISIEESILPKRLQSKNAHRKTIWFKKPLAFKQAPYDLNLWLDVDCKVVKPLDDLLKSLDHDIQCALCCEKNFPRRYGKEPSASHFFNSGVVLFRQHSSFIQKWIDHPLVNDKRLKGDQDSLTLVLNEHLETVKLLDISYNTFMNPLIKTELANSHIIHYIAKTKLLLELESQGFYKLISSKKPLRELV